MTYQELLLENEQLRKDLTDILALNKVNQKIVKILTSGIKSCVENDDQKWLSEALKEAIQINNLYVDEIHQR